jgi:hypothetical protein
MSSGTSRKTFALVGIAVVAGAGCGGGTHKSKPSGHLPPPQPTSSVRSGTPTGPSNTTHTTTSAGG